MKNYLWHRLIYFVLRVVVGPAVKIALNYKCEKQRGPDGPAIIISNHNANLDPALVGVGFTRHVYFVSSEHALRDSLAAKLVKFVFGPVAISKSHADVASIKEILRRLKAGANVCLFAEGDRSFFGTTQPIPASTAKLVKACGAQLITFRIEGGYFATPRWAKNKRKGRISGRIVGQYPAAELKSMANGQILGLIERDIYENAYGRQAENPVRYRGKDLAEFIETALYICPDCGGIGTIKSKGARFHCSCGLNAEFTETGAFAGERLRFAAIDEWGAWQTGRLAGIIEDAGDGEICSDEGQSLYAIRPAKGVELVGEGTMSIGREVFRCAGMSFPLSGIARFVVVGRMTLQFSTNDGASYEVHSAHPRSALKYKEIFQIIKANDGV